MTDIWRWFDHRGGIIETPATEPPPTVYGPYDQLNHWMFGDPSAVATFQALTLCGKRALEVPGRGAVDCPECIEIALDDVGTGGREDK